MQEGVEGVDSGHWHAIDVLFCVYLELGVDFSIWIDHIWGVEKVIISFPIFALTILLNLISYIGFIIAYP